ncbi:hypothetical protein TSOC_012527 [Tetrabaena socialis]|uniref:Cytochrome c domain-containing protein n=1 Tax=Tetrabaena socialis TaxID=47790 RepID=A0A2J7ZMU3_9CHLO|nr:hypothetical protein TSOC_012527 [Tetrabaena socialis]|eukprot:PNH01576.1 hypothetical protein TSOC_012527 [Tetrabaena socialis]
MTTRTVALLALIALAQGALAQTNTQWRRGRSRLFITDNAPASPAVIVVDLPAFNLTQRVAVPGITLQMGVSLDNAHLGVFRNRDNDQHLLSIISTGIRGLLPAAGPRVPPPSPLQSGEDGFMRPAVLAKSFLLVNGSDAIGGVEGGRNLVYHEAWKLYLAYAESHGTIFAYRSDHLHGATAFKPVASMRLPVGHFHVLPYGDFFIAPHTGVQKAFIVNRSGRTVREYNCSACHGSAAYVESPKRMTAVFGCNGTVLVVRNTEAIGVHVPAFPPRVGSFMYGAPGVFWSSTATQPFFWRTDVRGDVPTVTNVTHRGNLIRMLDLQNHSRFVAVHRDGNLVMYHGDTGAEETSLMLREAGFPSNMTAPFLQSDADEVTIYVTVPGEGAVHMVSVKHSAHDDHDHGPGDHADGEGAASLELVRTLVVGGLPMSMTLAYMPVAKAQ